MGSLLCPTWVRDFAAPLFTNREQVDSTSYCVYWGQELGKGTFGKVFRGVRRNDQMMIAIKEFKPNCSEQFMIEKKVLAAIPQHKNLVKYYGSDDATCRILLEYVQGGDLFDHVTEFDPLCINQMYGIYTQLVQAIRCIHDHGIAHRDIKLENILISTHGVIKLIDFNLAKIFQPNEDGKFISYSTDRVGSSSYAAPEMFQKSGYDAFLVDVYACSVCLFSLATSTFPFTRAVRTDKIYSHALKYPHTERITRIYEITQRENPFDEETTRLLNHTLAEAEDRWNIYQVIEYLGI